MNTERAKVGWGFWFQWVLASTVGWGLSMAVGEGSFGMSPVSGVVLECMDFDPNRDEVFEATSYRCYTSTGGV
jgi:hypothetical protein